MTISASRAASGPEDAMRTPVAAAARFSASPRLSGNRMSHAAIDPAPASCRPAAIAWPASPKPIKAMEGLPFCILTSLIARIMGVHWVYCNTTRQRPSALGHRRCRSVECPSQCCRVIIGESMKQDSRRDRLEQALARIADPKGEGARTCLSVYTDAARAAADAADARAARGTSLGPMDGIIVSIKDLFDVAGEPTRAGSKVLAEEAGPAVSDATVVQRLRAGGAIIIAKTNMTEFAFSGIGANPHFGTPGNPRDRTRVPGGSSAGAPVSVADGMCEIAIGTDNGGSVRIPAALCGVVGFKPSRQRVPTDGAFPLSYTLDSLGPIALSVVDCAKADAVMASEDFAPPVAAALTGLRFGVAEGLPLDRLDDAVSAAFAAALKRLDAASVRITRETLPQFDGMAEVNGKGGISPPEACAIHRDRLRRRSADIDPNVLARIERGCAVSAADYV